MKYLLAIDLETTGLDPNWHEIMQIGAVLLDKRLNPLGSFKTLVKIEHPERGIEEQDDGSIFNVYEYTGITTDSLEYALPLKEALTKLVNFIKNHSKEGTKSKNGDFKNVTIFGQNPKFEMNILKKAFEKYNIKFGFDYHVIGLDSIYTFYYLLKHDKLPEKIGLKYICDNLGTINPHEHDAMSDITTTIGALKFLKFDIQKRLNSLNDK